MITSKPPQSCHPESNQRRRLRRPRACLQDVPVRRDELQPAVEQLFSGHLLQEMMASRPDKYRERLLSIEVVTLALLSFVLSKSASLLELFDKLRAGEVRGLDAVEFSSSAFYKRLRVLPHSLFLNLLREATRALKTQRAHTRAWVLDLAVFANGVYAIDDTTLDALVRKTKALKKWAKGEMATLGGRLGCALDLTTGAYAELIYDPDSEANEKNHIRPLIERLGAGNMYVFDLGYFGFTFFDYMTDHFCYFVSRLRNKTSYKVIQTLAEGPHYRDQIIYLGRYRADRAAYPVRLVELRVGDTWYRYITNMLNPQILPAEKLWALYGQRWTIEKSFATLKQSLGMGFLHPCHQNGMLIQVWCTLAVYQVLQDLRLHIAAANGWHEDQVSWLNLMRRISWYAEKPGKYGTDLRSWLVTKASVLALEKRGVRKRRREALPPATLRACQKVPEPPNPQALNLSKARQSKPQPRAEPSKTIIGRLS